MSSTMQPRDRWIPWYFVLFFVVIAAVNAVMVTLAIRTHPGTVTEHPYEKGLAYNSVVNAETAQEHLGWNGTIQFAHGQLQFTLRDAKERNITPPTATAHFFRPSQSGMDFEVKLPAGTPTPIDFPAKGLWEVRIFATVGDTPYQQAKRIVAE